MPRLNLPVREGSSLVRHSRMISQVFTKTTFDGVGRPTATYQGYYTPGGSEPYAEVGQVTSDNAIFEQVIVEAQTSCPKLASAPRIRW